MVASRRFTASGKLSDKMAASSSKIPPLLSKSPVYTDWKKKIDIWSSFTTLEKDKQGAAVLLTLEGAAEEAALELDVSIINSNDGLKSITRQLDKLYLKDKTLEKFQASEAFDSYQRKPETSIHEHIHNFEKFYFKLKRHGTTISQDLLAYKLLKSVNLSTADEKLAKATTNELTFVSMKSELKKIFPDASSISPPAAEMLSFHEIHEGPCTSITGNIPCSRTRPWYIQTQCLKFFPVYSPCCFPQTFCPSK